MKILKTNQLVTAVLTIALLSSCSNISKNAVNYQTPQKQHQLDDISHLTPRDKADLYQNIIAADLAAANEQYEVATSYYLAAARLSKNTNLIQLAIGSAQKYDDNLAVLQAAELWVEIEPTNIDAMTLKITGLLLHQDIEQAIQLTIQLFKLEKSLNMRAQRINEITLTQSPPIANAYFAQLSAKQPEALSVLFVRAAFFSRVAEHTKTPATMIKQSFSLLDKVLSVKPDFILAVELKTRLLYQARQDQKAEAYLRQLYFDYPKSQAISQLLGQLLYDLRKYDLSKQHYLSWLKNNKKDIESRFYLAASYFALSQYEPALKHYQQVTGKGYKPQLSYFFCGNSAAQIKQYTQATACYQLVSEGQYLTRSKIELAKIYAKTNQVNKALSVARTADYAVDENTQVQLINVEIEILDQHVSREKARERLALSLETYPDNLSLLLKKIKIDELSDKPEELVILLSKAEKTVSDEKKKQQFNLSVASMLRNNNHFQHAVDWLNTALVNSPENKEYLYARTLYKEPLGLYDEMISDFKHLLTLDPKNVNIKNALGYTLVDLNKELDLASQLIEEAYIAMPNNAAVIDSKGWLAYRQGMLEQAIQYLSISYKIAPSADVATHIGEVYWQSGKKEQALLFWKKAKALNEKSYLLKATVKRFGVEL
jgi:Tfp pilus assembly protein PilF